MLGSKLLDYIQTWIGVLASLLVLCIALGNENLHSQILKTTKDRINNSLNKALDLMESHLMAVLNISVPNLVDDGRRNSLITTKIKMLLAERQQIVSISLANKPRIEADRLNKLTCIENRFITVTAPFYSLLMCMLLFILDGCVFIDWIHENTVMTFLSLLLVVSLAYWGVLWIRDFAYIRNIVNDPSFSLTNKTTKKWSNLIYGIAALFILYFFVIFASHVETNVVTGRILVFGIGFAVGLIGATLPMSYRSQKGTNLPYAHSFLHALCFLVYCGAATWMLTDNAPWSTSIAPLLFEYSDTYPLIFLWSLFILINGLFVPFFSSQFAFQRIGEQAMTHIKQQEASLNSYLKEIELKINILTECHNFLDGISHRSL